MMKLPAKPAPPPRRPKRAPARPPDKRVNINVNLHISGNIQRCIYATGMVIVMLLAAFGFHSG